MRVLSALLVLSASALSGCCLERATCPDSLSVAVTGADGHPVERFSGQARFDGQTVDFRCGDPAGSDSVGCRGPGRLVLDGVPASVELVVETPEGARFEGTLQPVQSTFDPDGAFCPLDCTNGAVSVTLE